MSERTRNSPWTSGPAEILRHALGLLNPDTDVNRRLAMIAIDNAVELMIKTYLSLPRRVTGLTISRKEYQDVVENFPALLDALEKYAPAKIAGINLGEIEFYHRIRNELYHQGFGLTVEREKVEVYAQLASLLFVGLYGYRVVESETQEEILLAQFIEGWTRLERLSLERSSADKPETPEALAELLVDDVISYEEYVELERLRGIRNQVIHGEVKPESVLSLEVVEYLHRIIGRIEEHIK